MVLPIPMGKEVCHYLCARGKEVCHQFLTGILQVHQIKFSLVTKYILWTYRDTKLLSVETTGTPTF